MSAERFPNRTAAPSAVHVVVPDSIDDLARPSGGNAYDRQICRGLTATGWDVHEHKMSGEWPRPSPAAEEALARAIADIPNEAVVLVDGLVASTVPAILVPAADRLRLIVLVHMPLGVGEPGRDDTHTGTRERAVLTAARAVVTTSSWTRDAILDQYVLPPDEVYLAEPGVETAALAPGTTYGGELLCVAAVTPGKGHGDLLAALASNADLPWRCVCVGALDRAPQFVEHLRRGAEADGIGDRVHFAGPLTGDELDDAYAVADALVLASHSESYGMVVTEALARGLPVLATAIGGLPQAMGRAPDGRRPGLLVPPGDPRTLATALRSWLQDADLRQQLREAARQRRSTLSGWAATTDQIAHVLTGAAQ
ncbi:MAG TPA: glycosyltransferase family 4 protein [Jatrophihabitans sp.]